MNLPSYKECLRAGKEKLDELLVPSRVKRAKAQAELKKLELEEEKASKQVSLNEACSTQDLDFEKILTLQDDIAIIDRKLKQYDEILAQMFPEGE